MSVTTEKKIVGVLGCVLMVYLIIRAYSIPLVHDESATFFFYVHNGKFLPQENGFDANNHFLNSVLSFCFYKLFGSSELSLRLASLIFFPVFVFYWFKFSQLIADTFLRWVFILTGLFTHNFIEFFALSRGYGMSMAILIAALWYFIIAFKEERRIFLLYGILLLLLALYANLALLNTIILMMGLLLGYFYWLKKRSPPREGYWYFPTAYKERRKNVRLIRLLLIVCVAGISVCAYQLFEMKTHGNLYYGSGAGFWLVTVRSLKKMLMDTQARLPSAFIIALMGFCGGGLIFLLIKSKEKMRMLFSPAPVFTFLLFGNALAALLLNKLLQVNYAEDRVGIYFFPFFVCSTCFTADALKQYISWKYIRAALPAIALPWLFFPIHFFLHVNTTHSSLWYFECIPHRFYTEIATNSKQNEASPTIGGYRMRELSWAYQNFRHGGNAAMINYSNFPELISDFQIVPTHQLGNWKKNYNRLDYDKASGLSLLKRKTFLKKQLLVKSKKVNTGKITAVEFLNIYSGNVDSLYGENLYVQFKFTLKSWVKPFTAWLVMGISDSNGMNLRYERIPLDWLKTEWSGGNKNFVAGMPLPLIPRWSHKISCYLWNIDKAPFRLNDAECEIYLLTENNSPAQVHH